MTGFTCFSSILNLMQIIKWSFNWFYLRHYVVTFTATDKTFHFLFHIAAVILQKPSKRTEYRVQTTK